MATAAVQPFGFRAGYPQADRVKVVVCSRSNATASLSCNGSAYAITWVATDSDHASSPAGYTYTVEVTGLSSFTQYSYSVTQSGTTLSGSFYTAPANEQQSFMLYIGSCEATAATNSIYSKMRSVIQASSLPCIGLVHNDDLNGYTDTAIVTGVNSPAGTALTSKNYHRAVAYLASFGLYSEVTLGRDEDQIWVYRNLNLLPQWGDHEFFNDLGWSTPTANDYDTATTGLLNYHATNPSLGGGYDGAGYVQWHKFNGPLQPPFIRNLDVKSNHWGVSLGPLHIVAMDSITNGNGLNPPSVWYGSNQIDDCIASFVGASKPFNILCVCHSPRFLNASNQGTNGKGFADTTPVEYARLFTDANSLMGKSQTNGSRGTLLVTQGDLHAGIVTKQTGTSGTKAEWYYQVCTGSLAQEAVPAVTGSGIAAGDSYNGSTVEYISTAQTTSGNHSFRLEWRYLEVPSGLHAILENENGTEVWHKVFARPYGNDAVAESYQYVTGRYIDF